MPLTIAATLPLLLLLTKATAVLGVAVVVSLVLHRRSAGLRHVVWLTALTGVLLLPILAIWSPVRLKVIPSSFATAWSQAAPNAWTSPAPGVVGATYAPAPEPSTYDPLSLDNAPTGAATIASDRVNAGFHLTPGQTLFAGWALVALALLARLAAGMIAVRRIIRRATPVDASDVIGALYEIADRLGLERTPRVLISDDVTMPFASGYVTATIVLPRTSVDWTNEQLTAVLIHELAHVRRRDIIGHTLGRITCALYWFHPMVWLAARRLRDASERACDDLALELGTVPSNYAEHLLDLVTTARVGNTPAVAMALAHRREFEGRMLAILDPGTERRLPTRRQTGGLAGILVGLTLALAAAAPVDARPRNDVIPDQGAVSQMPTVAPVAPVAPTEPTPPVSIVIRERTVRYDSAAIDQKVRRAADAGFLDDTARRNRRVAEQQDDFNRAMRDLGRSASTVGLAIADEVLGAVFGRRDSRLPTLGALRLPLGGQADDPQQLVEVLLTDADPIVRRTAAWSLEETTADPAVTTALGKAVTADRDARVRTMAAWAMSSSRSSEAVASLVWALADHDPVVREMAAWALGVIGDDAAAPRLGELLEREPVAMVQVAAAWALGTIRPARAPASLGRLMSSNNSEVVTAAAWAAAEIGDPVLQSAIVASLRRSHEGRALDALIRGAVVLGVDTDSVDTERLLTSDNSGVRRAASRMLAGRQWVDPWPWPWPRVIPVAWAADK